jgi:polysaccharide biosynthesis/export protein
VREPGTYTLAEGMSVEDLILAAGGYLPGADQRAAEVARPTSYMERTQQTAETHVIALERTRGKAMPDSRWMAPAPMRWPRGSHSGLVGLERRVRAVTGRSRLRARAPGFEPARSVTVTGQVQTPGTYVLRERQERLLDVLQRAGGLTTEGHAPGLQLHRDGNLVATDMDLAERSPRSRFNLVLEPGDSINVPEFDPTVLVRGAVGFETRVLHVPGAAGRVLHRPGGWLRSGCRPSPDGGDLPGRRADAGRPSVHGHAATGAGAGEHRVRATCAGGGRCELGPGAVPVAIRHRDGRHSARRPRPDSLIRHDS